MGNLEGEWAGLVGRAQRQRNPRQLSLVLTSEAIRNH